MLAIQAPRPVKADRGAAIAGLPAIAESKRWQTALSQLSYHGSECLGRIHCLADRAPDYQIIRTCIQCLARRQDTTLIVLRTARRTNPRGYQLQTRVRGLQRLRLQGRTHQAIHTGLVGQGCKA